MPRYKLTISYDGSHFCGWQKQEPYEDHAQRSRTNNPEQERTPKSVRAQHDAPAPALKQQTHTLPVRDGESVARVALRTVQHCVEQAVREVVREPVELVGASRTDAGVHAKGQVAAFTCSEEAWPAERGAASLLRAINSRLPEDVLVVHAEIAHPGFDPIGDCVRKAYSYSIRTGRDRPLFDRAFVHWVHDALDLPAMRAAAATLVGEHDFAGFAAAGHGRKSTVRTLIACEVLEGATPGVVRIEVVGNGFLYNMVRIIAGTLVEVGRGRMDAGDAARALATKDRRDAGPTLPPTGLCLEWIEYPPAHACASSTSARA
jgi:tRNA pseudouridine38-40 synthase